MGQKHSIAENVSEEQILTDTAGPGTVSSGNFPVNYLSPRTEARCCKIDRAAELRGDRSCWGKEHVCWQWFWSLILEDANPSAGNQVIIQLI